jgi:hypothetical protein
MDSYQRSLILPAGITIFDTEGAQNTRNPHADGYFPVLRHGAVNTPRREMVRIETSREAA